MFDTAQREAPFFLYDTPETKNTVFRISFLKKYRYGTLDQSDHKINKTLPQDHNK